MQPIFRLRNEKLNQVSHFLYSYQDLLNMVTTGKPDYKHFLNVKAFMDKDSYAKFCLASLMEAVNHDCIQIQVEPCHIKTAQPGSSIQYCPLAKAIQDDERFDSGLVYQEIHAHATSSPRVSKEGEPATFKRGFWKSGTTILRATANWDRNNRAYPGILFLSNVTDESWFFPTGVLTDE